jgi:hypothetical protein
MRQHAITFHLSFFLSFLSLASPPDAFDSLDFSSSFSFCFSALAAACAIHHKPRIQNAASYKCASKHYGVLCITAVLCTRAAPQCASPAARDPWTLSALFWPPFVQGSRTLWRRSTLD